MNLHIFSRKTLTSLLMITYIGMISPISAVNAVAILSEVTPVPTVTNNQTPSYTFSSSTGGTIAYAGPCTSTTTLATAGNNTVTFEPLLTEMLYSTCQVSVDDGGGPSSPLNISSFTLDISIPTISIL